MEKNEELSRNIGACIIYIISYAYIRAYTQKHDTIGLSDHAWNYERFSTFHPFFHGPQILLIISYSFTFQFNLAGRLPVSGENLRWVHFHFCRESSALISTNLFTAPPPTPFCNVFKQILCVHLPFPKFCK